MTIDDIKANLGASLQGEDADNLSEVDLLLERSANTVLSKIDPIETMRVAALASTIHDDVDNYALPSDYKKIIDLIPQDNRSLWDKAVRTQAGAFDLEKAIKNKVISIEGDGGSKIIRINWKSRKGKTLHTMDSVTANGTWSAVGSATGIRANSIFKKTGSASIEFDLVASADGIQNTTMDTVDLTDEDEVADVFVWVYLPSAPTSITAYWGNIFAGLSPRFWTSVAQTTQADGTAFKVGWNLLKFPWATATESALAVDPVTVDSFKLTIVNATAMSNIRVDNIIFSIGRNFDIKYYSKYLLKSSSGTWKSRTTSDTDIVVLDNDAIGIYQLENLIEAANQKQNNTINTTQAKHKLSGDPASADPDGRRGLYAKYRSEYPSQGQKATARYAPSPIRRRW